MLASGGFIVFFKGGPLAWNGLLAWWLVLAVCFSWIVVITVLLLRAINRQAGTHGDSREQNPDLAAEVARLRSELARRVPAWLSVGQRAAG